MSATVWRNASGLRSMLCVLCPFCKVPMMLTTKRICDTLDAQRERYLIYHPFASTYFKETPRMLLSDKRIMEELAAGNLVIEPFDQRHLGTNSYDCRLGEWYFQGDANIELMHLDNLTE